METKANLLFALKRYVKNIFLLPGFDFCIESVEREPCTGGVVGFSSSNGRGMDAADSAILRRVEASGMLAGASKGLLLPSEVEETEEEGGFITFSFCSDIDLSEVITATAALSGSSNMGFWEDPSNYISRRIVSHDTIKSHNKSDQNIEFLFSSIQNARQMGRVSISSRRLPLVEIPYPRLSEFREIVHFCPTRKF